jgi:hypothetical protein
VILKVNCKILVLLRLFQNFEISDLGMAKIEKLLQAWARQLNEKIRYRAVRNLGF